MSDKNERFIYEEIIPQDRIYYLIMISAIFLLVVATVIFIITRISIGVLSTGLTLIFMIFFILTTREARLIVTEEEFIIKFWFLTFKTKLSDIDTVEIKDVSLLPEPYRGHIRFWVRGIKFFDDLRVLRLRDGDAVHIRTKGRQTIIVTSQNNQRLAEVLKQKKEVLQ